MKALILDFEQAKSKHLLFKSRLRSILYDIAVDEGPVLSHHECGVGKWIYGHAMQAYGHIPEMQELEMVHADIHISARKLVALHKEGKTREAKSGLSEMELVADRLIELLGIIEQKLAIAPSPISQPDTVSFKPDEYHELLRSNAELDKRIKQQIAENTEATLKYETVLAALQEGVVIQDVEGVLQSANQSAEFLLGMSLDQMRGLSSMDPGWESVYEDGTPMPGEQHPPMMALKTGKPQVNQLMGITKGNGFKVWLRVNSNPLVSKNGEITGVVSSFFDVTDSKIAEEKLAESFSEQQALNEELNAINEEMVSMNEELAASNDQLVESKTIQQDLFDKLQESEAKARLLISDAPVAIGVLSGRQLVIETANEMILQIWGKDKSVLGKQLAVALPELDGQPFLQILDDVFTGGKPFFGNEAKVLLERDSIITERYCNFVYQPLKNADGNTRSIMVVAYDVTDQVESKKSVEEINQRLSIALDAGSFGSTEVDLSTGKMTSTAQFRKCYGRNPEEEFTYPDLFNAMLPKYREEIKRLVGIAKENHSIYEAEYEVAWPDGSIHWISAHGRARYDDNGVATRMVGVVSDITEQVIARRQLEQAEAKLRLATEAAALGTWYINAETLEFSPSPRLKELFGYHPDEIMPYEAAVDQIVEGHRQKVIDAVNASIAEGKSYDIEYPIIGFHDKQLRWVRATGRLFEAKAGEPAHFSGAIIDITKQVTATQAIKESEERFRIMAESSGILIVVSDETGHATYFSKAWIELTGRSLDELLEVGWIDLIHPEDKDRYVDLYLEAINKRVPFSGEFRILTSDHTYRWLLAQNQPRFHTDGAFAGYTSACADITDQFAIREKLKDSEERLQLLADNISQLAWMTDDTGYIFWYNKRWYEYTGTTFEEMMGWGWEKVQHPDHHKRVVEKWSDNIESGEIFELTFPLRSKEGEFRWFLTRAVPLMDKAGKIIRWFGTNTDITEQRQDEQRKNDFIAMVSHELKTPLTSLMGYVQMLQYMTQKQEDPKLSDVLEKSKAQVKKMNKMITGFLDMSRFESGKIHLQNQEFRLNDLIIETIADTKLITSTHEIIFQPCDELILNADRDKISQVLTNLFSNAVKYSPKGKQVTVNCKKEQKWAIISVSDEGMGINEQDREKLFDRFYRVEGAHTKTVSGFGIGLYLSAEIIQRHQGKIWVESNMELGSTFYFSLPL